MAEPGSSEGGGQPAKALSDVKMESLLEQLRNKHAALKNNPSDGWNEFAKQIRMASLERKQFRDTAVIHESLEKLQGVITATTLAQILERINSACQKFGLKYSAQQNHVYISADHFYVEIQCDISPNNRSIRDVRVAHHSSQTTSMPAMTQALRLSNVQLFMDHIKGFMDMYSVNSEQSIKTKFFIVLQSLETDVDKINKCQMQSKNISVGGHLHKTPLGLVQPRNGGLPTKLTFFITPFDLLNEKTQSNYPMSLDSIKTHDLGMSATIGIEHHPSNHQLQTIPLMNYTRAADNRLVPSFVPSTNVNSVMMPAAFVLKFKKPIALSEPIIQQIERLQGACTFSSNITLQPMLDAIVKSSGLVLPAGTQSFNVILPGQVQNYYINQLEANNEPMRGGLVSKIPFSHPTGIPQIISLVRQQLMLNSMILSCIRSQTDANAKTKPVKVELKVVTNQLLTVTFKHSHHDSLVTVDIDIADLNSPKCSIYCNAGDVCTNLHASRVIQRCYSVPITIRAILKQAGHQEENLPPTKKVKHDQGEAIQRLVDIYSSRGHYMPYGSVNTASSTYSKNIQSNQYSLCLRRFSGYKRSSTAHLKPSNSLHVNSTKPSSSFSVLGHQPIAAQASEKSRLANTPMLASLLDDGDHLNSTAAHPLVSQPSQAETPMQQAPILTDLLEGSEGLLGADKKSKKPRKRRTTSETLPSPQSTVGSARKRKKSDNDDIVRELASKVKSEMIDSNSQSSHSSSDILSSQVKGQQTSTTPTFIIKPPYSKVQNSSESHLAKLLYGLDEEQRSRMVKEEVLTTADVFDSPKFKTEPGVQSLDRAPFAQKTYKKKTVTDDKKLVKQSASAEIIGKKRKSESAEVKLKESKSVDMIPESPGKKGTNRLMIKTKAGKVQVSGIPKTNIPPLTIKTAEGRVSPKEKVKKVYSEKDKKKKIPKSPGTAEPSHKSQTQDLYKMGFYGASNLKSLPKIPKRKPGESQASPTSPTTPQFPQKSPMQQRSPTPSDRVRNSFISNRQTPVKQDDQQVSVNRKGATQSPAAADPFSKRPALLPTPAATSTVTAKQVSLQKRSSLDAVIHRLSSNSVVGSNTSTFSVASRRIDNNSTKSKADSPADIDSPDDKSFVESHPVSIPVVTAQTNDPASPDPELIREEPKAIPLNSNERGIAPSNSQSSDACAPKSILVKQKAVSRPLTFSPKSSNSMSERLDNDLMDKALGCN